MVLAKFVKSIPACRHRFPCGSHQDQVGLHGYPILGPILVSDTGTRRIRVQTYPICIGGEKKVIFYSGYSRDTTGMYLDTGEGKKVKKQKTKKCLSHSQNSHYRLFVLSGSHSRLLVLLCLPISVSHSHASRSRL